MERGCSPPPSGAGGSGHGRDPPPGPTQSPTTSPMLPTTYDCSDDGSIGAIQPLIANAASKSPPDAPEQLILTCIGKVFTQVQEDFSWINRNLKALHSKLDTTAKAPVTTVVQYSPQQPSWSTIAAGGLPGHPRLQRQGPTLAAGNARIALKSPLQYYKRELIAHCNKAAGVFDRSVQRLIEDLNRATKQSEVVGELQSVGKLQSGDAIFRFDTTESRDSWRRCENDWIEILGVGAHLKQRHYTELIHSMKKRECQDSASTIAELYKANPRLHEAGVRILRTAFQKKTLTSDKATGPLLVSVGEPEHANEMVRQEINWRYQAHHCELFEDNAKPTQCFKCHAFGHMATHCRHAARCGYCSSNPGAMAQPSYTSDLLFNQLLRGEAC